jgi:DNA replication protein DnaC
MTRTTTSPSLSELETLRQNLLFLRLRRMAELYESEAKRAAKIKSSYTAYLNRLIEEEVLAKTERSVNTRVNKARFPGLKTIESFDFGFQPSISEVLVKELATLAFVQAAENIVLLGPPGVGKTHLAIGLGFKACAARKKVLFASALSLMDELLAALVSRSLGNRLEILSRLDLLIIDELGYLPMDTQRANLFFQLVCQRYEKGSIIVTSNKTFNQWGEVFGDDVIASAILDRLLHHCHIIPIQGESYRIKDKKTKTIDKGQKQDHNGNRK